MAIKNRIIFAIFILIGLFLFLYHSPISWAETKKYINDPQGIFKDISPAVAYITKKTATEDEFISSGFIVDGSGVVVMTYHGLYSAKEIKVKLKDGTICPAKYIIYYDAGRDICILKIDAKNISYVTLGDSSKVNIGEKVYTIGNPMGLEYSFSDGLISGIRDFNNLKWLQFTAPASGGSSGCPLINIQGEVIGVVTSGNTEGQNLNFALAINEIKPFITSSSKMTLEEFSNYTMRKRDLYFMLGNNSYLKNNFKEAIDSYKKALELNPRDADICLNLGCAYASLGEQEEALTYYQKALQLNPNDYEASHSLAGVYLHLKQYQQAIIYYQKALEINPSAADTYINLGTVYGYLGEYQQAIIYFQKAIKMDPKISQAYYDLGSAYESLGQQEEAADYYKKALGINPNYVDAYLKLGAVYSRLNQYKEAKENLQKAKELFQRKGDLQGVRETEEYLKKIH